MEGQRAGDDHRLFQESRPGKEEPRLGLRGAHSVPLDLGRKVCGTMAGSTWTAKSSMSAGLARAASRAVVVVPMLEPRKRG